MKLLAETCVQRDRKQVSQSGVTFGETCLAIEVQKGSQNHPCYTVQCLLKRVSQCGCTQVSANNI